MATPDQIPSDLTLEIGGNLSPDKFMSATRAFFGYVQEVSRAIAADDTALDWVVCVREGSQLIGVNPGPKAHFVTVKAVYASIKAGVSNLDAGTIEESDFSETAIKHLKTLSEISEKATNNPVPIKLWVQKSATYLGSKIAETIREDRRGNYKDFGSLEGKLQVIQDKGRIQLRVLDVMLKQNVRCNIPEDMLNKAFDAFRQRVEVFGLIHYRKGGYPISIEVQTIERLPDDKDLPSIDDVCGILRQQA